MKNREIGLAVARVVAVGVAGVMPLVAQAQMAQDEWKFGATLYGWLPSISGKSSFPAPAGPSVDVSSQDIIDHLKMTFMGTFEAKRGQWGLWTDVAYVDLGGSKSGSRDFSLGNGAPPATLNADLSLDVKATVWTIAGTYSLTSTPEYTLDLVAGARLLDMKEKLNYQLNGAAGGAALPARAGSLSASEKAWDGIVGIKGRANFGADRKWFIPYYFDIGTGQTQLTWQAMAGVGYQFDWGAVTAAWRYLDYNFESSHKLQGVALNGPLIGLTWRW